MQEPNLLTRPSVPDPFADSIVLNLRAVNGSILDMTGKPITNTGVTAASDKTLYNAQSMRFAGAQYMTIPSTTSDLWLDDVFTIEAHLNLISKAVQFPAIFGNYSSWPSANGLQIFADHSSALNCYSAAMASAFPAIKTDVAPKYNIWTHFAMTRNAVGVVTIWVDGVAMKTASITAALYGTKDRVVIGAPSDGPAGGGMNGYMDGLRITKDCRYTVPFTPKRF